MGSPVRAFAAGVPVLLITVLGFGSVGCGSDSGSTATGTDSAGSTASSETAPAESSNGKAPTAASGSSPGSSRDRSDTGSKPGSGAKSPEPGDVGTARRRAARICPEGLAISQCEVLIEEIENAKRSGSPTTMKPHSCREVMSRAECEAMLATQQAASQQAGEPIDVSRCLDHPTPRCRAALGPALEAQYAASQEAGK